jgi:phosphatidylserine/phosphatidylglycerophosphate/cardiolipin synthase-like enzyme
LTSRPALEALVEALKRGVDVRIITSRRLMILEQLVTAGTHTEHEVRRLARHYAKLKRNKKAEIRWHERRVRRGWGLPPPDRLGSLSVGYYQPKEGNDPDEPTKSHLKLVCVDDHVTVLGSGNMDRASWYTSQELAVAFFSKDLSAQLSESVEDALKDRVKYAYQLSFVN